MHDLNRNTGFCKYIFLCDNKADVAVAQQAVFFSDLKLNESSSITCI